MKNLKFPYLFSPLRVGNIILKNRIMAAPMGIPKAVLLSTSYYGGLSLADKAAGGSGAVVVSSSGPADLAHCKSPFDKYARDATRETLSLLEESGAVGVMEFPFHPQKNEDGTIQAPSDGIAYTGEPAKAMTEEQMKQQIGDLCEECRKAKEFGFRMIMLHFGHDSQCSIFLSPVWNRRTDQYGGSLENRTRFAREALQAVRKTVGPDYPLMVRVSRQLIIPETYAEDDMLYFINSVKDIVDIFNISAGMDCYGGDVEHYEANVYAHTTIFEPRYLNMAFAARVKKETGAMVSLVGGVSDPEKCDEMIRKGQVDAVMLGRQLVADPFWPVKAQQGREEEIVPCLRCLNCYHIATEHANTQCSVNPRFRRENRVPLVEEKSPAPKKVVVVGGGPAGMKAALTADAKGHHVILLEARSRLGGQLLFASEGVYKEDMRKFQSYLIREIDKSGVEVRLNTKADRELLEKLEPDDVILAIGGEFVVPPVKGVEKARQAATAYQTGLERLDGKVLIIGGGTIGTELALELAEMGREVTIVEMSDTLCAKGNRLYRIGLRHHLEKCTSLTCHLSSQVTEIRDDGAFVKNKEGDTIFVEADHVFLAAGVRPRRQEAFSMYGVTPETFLIGDCKNAGTVLEAVNDGYFAGAYVR